MTLFAVLRHATTEWNEAGRLQGRIDTPLSGRGRADLAGKALPIELAGCDLLTSPLARCHETARLIAGREPVIDKRLTEMDWGAYQGFTIAELREMHGIDLSENESKGLDFLPPGGESPRQVQARLRPLLAECAAQRRDTLAVTHRGVIRALYCLATGWSMLGKPPLKFDWQTAQLFRLDETGRPRLERVNLPLRAANEG